MQRRKFFQWALTPVALGLLGFMAWCAWVWWSLPEIPDFKECYITRLYRVTVCPRAKSFVRSQTLPEHVRWSFILAEDGSFYQHQGVDWFEMQKSLAKNWQQGEFVRGGSTITQQLAKNLFLSKDKTITRKLKEMILARRLELQLNKTRILDLYLNVIEFGKNLYGLRAASQHYFGKDPRHLSVFESVFLASLLPNPVAYQAGSIQSGAHPRHRFLMKIIAQRLRHFSRISEEDYSAVIARLEQNAPLDEPALPEDGTWADLSVEELEERYFRNESMEPAPENIPVQEPAPETSPVEQLTPENVPTEQADGAVDSDTTSVDDAGESMDESALETMDETGNSPVGQDNEEGEQNSQM